MPATNLIKTMSQSQQLQIVDELCDAIRNKVKTMIERSRVPAEWDGHELRDLVARVAADYAHRSTVRKNPCTKRARSYRNFLIVNEII